MAHQLEPHTGHSASVTTRTTFTRTAEAFTRLKSATPSRGGETWEFVARGGNGAAHARVQLQVRPCHQPGGHVETVVTARDYTHESFFTRNLPNVQDGWTVAVREARRLVELAARGDPHPFEVPTAGWGDEVAAGAAIRDLRRRASNLQRGQGHEAAAAAAWHERVAACLERAGYTAAAEPPAHPVTADEELALLRAKLTGAA